MFNDWVWPSYKMQVSEVSVMNPDLVACQEYFIWVLSSANWFVDEGGCANAWSIQLTIFNVLNIHALYEEGDGDCAVFKVLNYNIFLTFVVCLINNFSLIFEILNAQVVSFGKVLVSNLLMGLCLICIIIFFLSVLTFFREGKLLLWKRLILHLVIIVLVFN